MTELRLLVLGLLGREPRSAYAVGQALAEMPAANFSGSPGAVYPAIRALQKAGLVSSTEAKTRGTVLSLSAAGREVLEEWLDAPVEGWDLVRAPGSFLLRLSFLGNDTDRARFRADVGAAAKALNDELSQYAESANAELAPSAAESIQLTQALLAAYTRWAEPLA